MFGCSEIQTTQVDPEQLHKSKNESIQEIVDLSNKEPDSLDRILKMMTDMNSDLILMNNNLEKIFIAVTDCESQNNCDEQKEKYIKEYEKKHNITIER
jgi:hypothetical protein